YGTALNRVVLFLDSAGGRVDDGDRLIEVLNEIKLRHQLITVVPHGKLCASMCIPIFLQGEDRLAAPASIWLFHEAAQRQANGILRTDTAETWRLFRKYYAPAGVPTRWLKSIAPMIEETDLWQTGGDLISAKSGIILHSLGHRTVRDLTAPPVTADRGRDLPSGKKTAADEVGNVPIRSEYRNGKNELFPVRMSALEAMSALPPKADKQEKARLVRFVPIASLTHCSRLSYSIISSARSGNDSGVLSPALPRAWAACRAARRPRDGVTPPTPRWSA